MTLRLSPYISFRDTAAEAMQFYRSVFGGDLRSMTFGDIQMPGIGEDDLGKIMHSQLDIGPGLTLMASDAPAHIEQPTKNHAISLSGDDEATLRGWWDGLAEGGSIDLPLNKAPWGDTFGQLTDRFGIQWLVNIEGAAS